ncbi:Uncharacterised protein [uncultured Clostridium sp.]|uniref:SdpI family protein n=1 Tax=uncultured Clostridium sp. TaxID=59620 RepID=UPI000823232F|nr:SdpI family protein [uncultured Clostridium sp.]SCJ94953.1 Uncharacterised protein [uncultured Clostridium sp.]
MAVWQLLIIYEIVPIVLWGFAWYYENSYSQFPDTSKGFKTKCSKENEEIWNYANKTAAKILNITAIALFIFIAITLIMLPISFIFIAIIIVISIVISLLIINIMIRRKVKYTR